MTKIKYRGYEISPAGKGFAVYRNGILITTEPQLKIAFSAIDNRIYSNPDFNRSGYQSAVNSEEIAKKFIEAERNKRIMEVHAVKLQDELAAELKILEDIEMTEGDFNAN